MSKENVMGDASGSTFCDDGVFYTFFANGFQFEPCRVGVDADFIQYSEIKNVTYVDGEAKVTVMLRGRIDGLVFRCESMHRAEYLADKIVGCTQAWLNQPAVQRKEEREFRASLLAKLGDVLDRIMFEPGVGYEAFEAVDKCNKRALAEK